MSLNLDKSNWRRVKFGEVVRNVNNTTKDPESLGIDRVIAMEHLAPGELSIDRWGETSNGTTFTRVVNPGQTLFGKRRAYQRKVAYAEFRAICSGDIYTFEAAEVDLLPQLLPFIVQSEGFFDHALGTSAGSLSPRTNWRDLADFEFDLPPIEEQERLAKLLWAVERHRVSLTSLTHELTNTASCWIAHVRTATTRIKYVRDVAVVKNGQNYPKAFQDGRPGNVPFFKVADLDRPGNARYLTNPGGWLTDQDVEKLKAEVLPPGTVVTARVGAAIRLERRRLIVRPSLVDENHLTIRPFDVDPSFLLALLSETQLARSRNDGVVPSLNQKIVGNVQLPALDRAGEKKVGAMYADLGDSRDCVEREMVKMSALRSSLLNEIFGGN